MPNYYLACDLGADSGRLMLGTLEGEHISLEELHRFPNTPVKSGAALHWNIQSLIDELKIGLKKAAARQLPISSISCDSWGVDYLLFAPDGQIMLPVFHYRDARTQRGVENAKARVDWPTIYGETGIQFMALNTIYQLAAEDPARLAKAKMLLCIGDAFNYFLSNVAKSEESLASTTQLYNPRTKTWSARLLGALGLPQSVFTEIVPSGTPLGPMCPQLAAECGLKGVQVIASCSHDTGAAVAAVPGFGEHWAYLSSGTWSLMGVEIAPADHQRHLPGVELHERDRFWQYGAFAQEHHRPVARAGVAPRLGQVRPELRFCGARENGQRGARLHLPDQSDGRAIPESGRHAGEDRGVLPGKTVNPFQPLPAPRFDASMKAWRCCIAARCFRSNNSPARRSKNCILSVAGAKTRRSTNSRPTPRRSPWWLARWKPPHWAT